MMNDTYRRFRILLLYAIPDRISDFEEVLVNAGHTLIAHDIFGDRLLALYEQEQPDLLILDVNMLTPDQFSSLQYITSRDPCPIIVFTGDADRISIEKAIAAGISAYVVQGYSPKRIIPVMDTAIHRFNRSTVVHSELKKVKHKLEDRRVIEQAKGIVMKKAAVDESVAYKTLRDMAMHRNMKLSEIARSIVTASELLV